MNEPELLNTTVESLLLPTIPIPWWLPPLETPSETYLLEHNNYSEYYLCNITWWKVVNPTIYYQ